MTTFQKLASSSAIAVRQALAKRLRLIETGAIQSQQPPRKLDARFAGEAEEAGADELQAAQLREATASSQSNAPRTTPALSSTQATRGSQAAEVESVARSLLAVKTAVTDFLCEQFSEIDFLADKLHWLSVTCLDAVPTKALETVSKIAV